MAAHIISYTALIGLIVGFFLAMKRILTRDNYINSLILAFLERGEISKDELIDKMYEYGCKDFRLRRIIARHEATRADYVMIFEKLMIWGNFKKRHRYVPVSSFFFVGSLDYLLEHKHEDAKKMTMKMFNYFHI